MTQLPKGTKDILPSEIYKWQYVEKLFSKICSNFGYKEIRIPTFEHTELFERGVGDDTDIVQKEMYTFNDKGGRSITLRPEGTAGVVRSYIQNGMSSLPQPVKLYYNISAFRYEKMQKGRYREFHQLGVEAFGSSGPAVDVEIISLCNVFFKELGLKDVQLNINSIGCKSCRKKYNDKLMAYLNNVADKLCDTCKVRLIKNPLRILDCKETNCKKYTIDVPLLIDNLCNDCADHFLKVKQGLNNLGIDYNVDGSIVRGLDYYTKTVFEFISNDIGTQGTICGGGRYDGLVELCGGVATPGVGFALGIERLLLIMDHQDIFVDPQNNIDIFIVAVGEQGDEYAQKIVYELRKIGKYKAEKDLMGRSLKAQLKGASKLGARYCLFLGDDELQSKSAVLKNMLTQEQINFSLEHVNDYETINYDIVMRLTSILDLT